MSTPVESVPPSKGAANSGKRQRGVVFVAVHGIGEPVRFDTIKTVARQVCAHYGEDRLIPLGKFHQTGTNNRTPAVLWQEWLATPPPVAVPIGFAEVYWADIPRQVVKVGYTLEETKAWAKTVVRIAEQRAKTTGITGINFKLVARIIDEMMTTIGVLENLVFLAERAGLGKFELRELLVDFLGDVQLVADFAEQRSTIMKLFGTAMAQIEQDCSEANVEPDIYLIAHSEGTVVSFCGLLNAFSSPAPVGWATKVRGMMTIGSPIDKHFVLWPEVFDGTSPAVWAVELSRKILWKNYYDFGDPVGYELDTAREFISQGHAALKLPANGRRVSTGWPMFSFRAATKKTDTTAACAGDDHGFARYWLPGKAHIDYWQDDEVFAHFFETVVQPTSLPDAFHDSKRMVKPPGCRPVPKVASYVVPYLLACALVALAVYVLAKGFSAAREHPSPDLWKMVFATSVLLSGLSAASRIPRLTHGMGWRLIAVVVLLLSFVVYGLIEYFLHPNLAALLPVAIKNLAPAGMPAWLAACGAPIALVAALWVAIRVAESIVLKFGYVALGSKPLMVIGGFTVLAIAYETTHGQSRVWPIILSGAAFIYLWWLAVLLFDLVFVWHRYIRHSVALKKLRPR